MIIETDFTYGNNLLLFVKAFNISKVAFCGFLGFVSVNTDSGINKVILFCKSHGCETRFEITTAVYNMTYSLFRERSYKLISVFVKTGIVVVSMGVKNIFIHLSYL